MPYQLARPPAAFDAGAGLLRTEHFQMAYATNDIDRACDILRQRYGVREFRRLEGQLPAGGHIRVELAWIGPIMYELITASGPGSDIYIGRLPDSGFALRHHHLGYLIRDDGQWETLMRAVERDGWSMPHLSHNKGFMKSCFIDAPELGHYLEYICPEQAGVDFFDNVPRH